MILHQGGGVTSLSYTPHFPLVTRNWSRVTQENKCILKPLPVRAVTANNSVGDILEFGWEEKVRNVVWPVLALHTAHNDSKFDSMMQACTMSNGNASLRSGVTGHSTDGLIRRSLGRDVRIQVRAEEAWLPPPCFAASHQVPTHLETYLNASIFPDQNVKKLKRRSRWEIACRRIKSLHRMPGRPHYPPYWASFTRSPAPQPYGYQCPMLAITRENNHQCLGNGVSLTFKVFSSILTVLS